MVTDVAADGVVAMSVDVTAVDVAKELSAKIRYWYWLLADVPVSE